MADIDYYSAFTSIQSKKVKQLQDRGGELDLITVYVTMPDNSAAIVDPFGRVLWIPLPNNLKSGC